MLVGCHRPESPGAREDAVPVVSGRVISRGQAVSGARVRYPGRDEFVLSDNEGEFSLPAPTDEVASSLMITAGKPGYIIAGQSVGGGDLEIELPPLPRRDDESYRWVDPTPDATTPKNCGNCHEEIFDQWHAGGHAHSATNPHFLDLYAGTASDGSSKQGWGLLTEYPEAAGVCNACHAPAATLDELALADIRSVTGVARQGVHCDYCHKIQDVNLSAVGLTHGRFAAELLRPDPASGQLFFGPLDDVDRGEDSFLPLQSESRFCAPCHEGTVFGVPVYTTYSEWLQSPARSAGKQCQTCHMQPDGQMTNFAPNAGGLDRDPHTLASHALFPGGHLAMLQRCLRVTPRCRQEDQRVRLTLDVVAQDAGHRVPTGFIDRHLMLVVEARDDSGNAVTPISGPRLPDAAVDHAGKPGVLWAKRLFDEHDHSPVPFWRAGTRMEDNRLPPDVSQSFEFQWPRSIATVRVRLLYRRFWLSVANEKQWPDPTQVVLDETWTIEELRIDDSLE